MQLKFVYLVVFGLICLKIEVSVSHPNIVFLIADDLGIGDVGCFGNDTIRTPNIDSLAHDGIILQHHLAAAALCTPSRAALLTARYPARYGLVGTENTARVIVHAASRASLPRSELTLADVLKKSGYATGAVGKWHLGSGCQWLGRGCVGAQNYGFDHFYGLLFTLISELDWKTSFWIFDLQDTFYQTLLVSFCVTVVFVFSLVKSGFRNLLLVISFFIYSFVWFMFTHYRIHTSKYWQVSPWMNSHLNGIIVRNGEVTHQTPYFESLTNDLVDESVQFINTFSNSDQPFFLYHSFAHVHTPLFSTKDNQNRSCCGKYGDNVEEMDDGVGIILDALRANGVHESTIVYFASDHGGHLEIMDFQTGQRMGGYNKLFKGGKGAGGSEGGIRVPGIIRWSKRIKPGSSLTVPMSMMDIFPSVLELAGLPSVSDLFTNSNTLDGESLAKLLLNPEASKQNTSRILLHYCSQSIHALRLITDTKIYKMYLYLNRWKKNSTQCGWGDFFCNCYGDDVIDVSNSPVVYELESDPYEDSPLDKKSTERQLVVDELQTYLNDWKRNVSHPPSIYSAWLNMLLLPWIQPSIYH